MSSFRIFDIAGSAMNAQNVRLNLTASNLANAESVSSSINTTYRSRQPVFAAQLTDAMGNMHEAAGVHFAGVVESQAPLRMEHAPNNPAANEDGYIFKPNVNVMDDMANMMSASRSYEQNVQMADTAKQLMLMTLRMGQN
ncbi:MAG: hypothetical protein RIQ52_1466 [Pseudomonadota bacterium]|jgi:flagellar basal-body rod protein FlgC